MDEKQVVADEVCEKEFIQWCDENGVDYDETAMNDESLVGFKKNKQTILKACKEGRLVFDGGCIEYTVSNKSPEGFSGTVLKIGQPSGRIFTATDGYKETELFKKQVSIMSALTGKDLKFFDKLHAIDFRVLQAVVLFFLTI